MLFASPAVSIVAVSILGALFTETLSWFLVYRTASYQRMKENVERLAKKVEKQKESGSKRGKQVDRSEELLRNANQNMTMAKMKCNLVVAATMITIYRTMSSYYDGVPVAHLPFEPFSLIRGISHRGLLGTNFYECAFAGLYVLCSMSIRSNLQKILGFAPPRGSTQSSLFPTAPQNL
eukprot:Rmarinus@m.7220